MSPSDDTPSSVLKADFYPSANIMDNSSSSPSRTLPDDQTVVKVSGTETKSAEYTSMEIEKDNDATRKEDQDEVFKSHRSSDAALTSSRSLRVNQPLSL